MRTTDRILIDDARWHPTLVFIQDRETRDTIAVDVRTGSFVGVHRGDYRRPITADLIEAALSVGDVQNRRAA
jgi:hypothetical protein